MELNNPQDINPKKARKSSKKEALQKPATNKSLTLTGFERENALFHALDSKQIGYLTREQILTGLEQAGLRLDDPRLKEIQERLDGCVPPNEIKLEAFATCIAPCIGLVEQAIQGRLIIPDFSGFCEKIKTIYDKTATSTGGKVADYIPQLGRVDPEQYAVSLCTIDGQRFSLGESNTKFCVQSTCKPINYCLALNENPTEIVHEHVGREPSGRGFNELALNHNGRPHNPMINAGAIMSCSLIKPELNVADRFDYVMERWGALAGGNKPSFSNSVYLSERQTADRNFALGYFMRENEAFPKGTELIDILEFYFQCCSIELTADMMSVIAATLANGGVCPVTGERVFGPETVQNCLSLMYSCGMYDFSGEFAFTIGLPAKSGVSGAMMIVVPNVMGLCTWSPRLDRLGNSVRGIEFCKELVGTFNFHNYDNLTGVSDKIDPRLQPTTSEGETITAMIWAASKGDLTGVQQLIARGASLDKPDYDGRAPLHLAAAEGRAEVVELFIHHGANLGPVDRWGQTPLEDAKRGGHKGIVSMLERAMNN
ncbi:MAG: glutaminase A [Myxococcota bacterium]|nr:glutaminase A [Myxococcota bacterium]